MLPVIALVGRPNVGKSTLFNVLTKSRDALVADYPGLTRDRKYGHGHFNEQTYILIDTGGLSGESEELDEHMAKQTLLAIDEANLVLLMVDGRAGITAADESIARQIRRLGKNLHLVINKTDGIDVETAQFDFASLGFSESYPIAAAHKKGVTQLIEKLLGDWPAWDEDLDSKYKGIRVAIVGKPNVGKSTLINRMLGEERVVVMDMPGTTRDSIYIPFEHEDQEYTLIDTAGVRRQRKVKQTVEKFSVIKTLQAIDNSNVTIIMIDARSGISDQDLHLLGYSIDSGRALIIVINKWDGMADDEKEQIKEDLERRLSFVQFAELYFISALHGSNVGLLYRAINKTYDSATKNLPTSELTRILDNAVQAHQPPTVRGRRIKLRYAHQGGKNPPIVVIHGNQTDLLPKSYIRYLMNHFIDVLKLTGTPMKMEFKTSENPYARRDNPRKVVKKIGKVPFKKKFTKKKTSKTREHSRHN
ncbi:GTP-binding protein EngA [hydrothermal vent metagenome]|uniref:GTPase Der n=1 Tax=hydrothermal vent metagenome TaxID=652676 RepID=A0A3B0WVN2_9ZZZZ